MKKNWIMRSAYLVLAVLLISTVAVSGTFAKYTWTVTSDSSTAQVAKFGFTLNDATVVDNTTTDFDIDLFETIVDTVDGQMDAHVLNDDTTNTRIAPGTQGSFELNFKNNSEVAVALTYAVVAFENADVPIEFQVNDGDWKSELDLAALNATTVAIEGEVNNTVNWRWVFGDPANNASDTELGFAANGTDVPTVALQIKATVDQVD